MLNYVTTVLVSNLNNASNVLTAAPANASALNTPSADAGKFIIMNCDANVASTKLYEVTADNAASINTIKIGVVTKKNMALHQPECGPHPILGQQRHRQAGRGPRPHHPPHHQQQQFQPPLSRLWHVERAARSLSQRAAGLPERGIRRTWCLLRHLGNTPLVPITTMKI